MFYEQLRLRRAEAGLTQELAANRAGVKRTTLATWEQGRQEVPLRMLPTLARIYGLDSPLGFLEKMPTYEDLARIRKKPFEDRTFEEDIIVNFDSDILAEAAPEEVKKSITEAFQKKAERIQTQHGFIQQHNLLERFGGILGGDLVQKLQEEYSPDRAGCYDDDVLFAYHCLTPQGKENVLRVLIGALYTSRQGFLTKPAFDSIHTRLQVALQVAFQEAKGGGMDA